ncbi:MAG: DUF1566 domain-containing protein [Oligoflexus sp.]|nr:DUF1566 domain-containing protein [Oligoflexus sp.]
MLKAFHTILSIAVSIGLLGCQGNTKVKTARSTNANKKTVLRYQPGAKIVVEQTTESYPVSLIDPAQVCNTVTFYNQNGDLVRGTHSCDGAGVNPSDPNLKAENIKAGIVIGTIEGIVKPSPIDCNAGNLSGCVTTSTYRSMDLSAATAMTDLTMTNFNATIGTAAAFEFWDSTGARNQVTGTSNLSVDNVKSGVMIFGVTGDYPSATYTLSSASGTADLDAATFDAKAKSGAAFEYWNSAGGYQTGTGDADIIASNIVSTATIFGLTGNLTAPAAIDPWNVRVGSVINGVTGQLKTSCRNRANTSLWDTSVPYTVSTVDATADTLTITGHSFTSNMTVRVGASTAPTGITINSTTYYVIVVDANTIKLSAASGPGAQVDITAVGSNVTIYAWSDGTLHWWDTIDDYNNNLVYPTSLVASWSSDTDCNYSNWQDLTADGACDTAADNCIMKDKISGLTWSESHPVAAAAAATTTLSWQKAIQHCNNLSFGGFTGWRLATQKELMEAYIHGIRDVGYNGVGTIRALGSTHNNNLFILDIDQSFWSATAVSDNATDSWILNLFTGYTFSYSKSSAYQVLCVR